MGAFSVEVKARLTVQRALAVPIEDRGAGAALRNGFRATGRMFAHGINLT